MELLGDPTALHRASILPGRGRRWLRHRRWLVPFVVLPAMLTALYDGLFATARSSYRIRAVPAVFGTAIGRMSIAGVAEHARGN